MFHGSYGLQMTTGPTRPVRHLQTMLKLVLRCSAQVWHAASRPWHAALRRCAPLYGVVDASRMEQFPLHTAAEEGLADTLRLLLRRHLDVNETDARQWTALHCAASCRQLLCCQLLLQAGADPTMSTTNGSTPLHYVARVREDPMLVEVLSLLVEKGADVNAANNQNNTPLHEASWRGALKSARFLVQHGASVHLQNQ